LATVDPAAKRRLFERLSSIREIVFGVQDGVLTTAGVLCGLSGAVSQHSQVALAALASTAAGALSMAAGAYLGARAETEVLRAELDLVRADAAEKPYTVQEGLLDELCKEGLSREAGYRVVRLLSTAPKALESTAEAKMFGLGGPMLGRLITVQRYDLGGALAATALTLFGVGYFEGWLAHRNDRWRSGVRFLAIAMSAAAAGYLIGLAISPLGATAG
jgi:VIT1/CCC1 family predicted Fe2+/Mn2+ transporter